MLSPGLIRAFSSCQSSGRWCLGSHWPFGSRSEKIPIVPLYYAKEREVIVRGNSLIVQEQPFVVTMPGEKPQMIKCRMRSLGCSPCTGAVRSDADTIPKIIEELIQTKQSERLLRIIDHDQDGSMELKKREGYF
jgi:sulfate adenylyltransferase subunit 2